MMNKMIDIFIDHRTDISRLCRVLELETGTGIFTQRLTQIPSLSEIVAIEID